MRSSVLFGVVCAALARTAVGQSSDSQSTVPTSTAAYTNPFTSFLSMTDSKGVVTGMPTAASSQPVLQSTPAGATSALTVTFPSGSAVAGGAGASSGFSTATGAAGSNGTVASPTPTASASESGNVSGGSGATGSASGSAASSTASKGAAPFMEPAMGLGFAGAVFAAFL